MYLEPKRGLQSSSYIGHCLLYVQYTAFAMYVQFFPSSVSVFAECKNAANLPNVH